ncbi:TolC family protein [Puniceicoccaceae bacterium K14]|nr:TolC family protein [Puniceicoccaceae bacterium K14]
MDNETALFGLGLRSVMRNVVSCFCLSCCIAATSVADERMVISEEIAIDHALRNGFAISLAAYSPEIAAQSLNQSLSVYDTSINLGYSIQDNTRTNNEQRGYDLGLSGLLGTGTSYSVALDGSNFIDSNTSGFIPYVASDLLLVFSQSLLRDFGGRSSRSSVQIARKQRDISLLNYESSVMNIVAGVSNAYYNLYLAKRNLEVSERSRDLALNLLKGNKARLDVGTMSEVDYIVAESALALRDEQVIISKSNYDVFRDQMKELIFGDSRENIESIEFSIEEPEEPTLLITNVDADLELALEIRPDYEIFEKLIEVAEIGLGNAKSQKLPDLKLNATYGVESRGTSFVGGVGNLNSEETHNYSVGLTGSYSLQNRSRKASVINFQIELDKAKISHQQRKQSITLNLKRGAELVRRNWKRLEVSRKTYLTAEKSLNAEEKKLEYGTGTTLDVLNLQVNLINAESGKAQAVVDYYKSVVAYRGIVGNILKFYDVDASEFR